jgi:hypothetical protein
MKLYDIFLYPISRIYFQQKKNDSHYLFCDHLVVTASEKQANSSEQCLNLPLIHLKVGDLMPDNYMFWDGLY